jgi:transketolase
MIMASASTVEQTSPSLKTRPPASRAYGWNVESVDGHDFAQIESAIAAAQTSEKPSLICCKTHIGFGAPTKQDKASSHGSPLGIDEIRGARENLGWPHDPFEIPEDILHAWRHAGRQGGTSFLHWTEKHKNAKDKKAFDAALSGETSDIVAPLIAQLKKNFAAEKPIIATRQASGKVLEVLVPALPALIGGSADLTDRSTQRSRPPKLSRLRTTTATTSITASVNTAWPPP